MNDCVWGMMFCYCELKCDKYLSANCEKGQEVLTNYQNDIDKALKPVKLRWQEMQQEGSIYI
jgi:hypothetical protein